jgi:hypothetical protein
MSDGRCECEVDDSASCGRAVLDNVGTTVTEAGRPFGPQHCQGGQPREARWGDGASSVRRSTRTRARRRRLMRGAVSDDFGVRYAAVALSDESQTSSEGAPSGSAPGREHLGCQMADANGRPPTARRAGVPGMTFRGPPPSQMSGDPEASKRPCRAPAGSASGRERVEAAPVLPNENFRARRGLRAYGEFGRS